MTKKKSDNASYRIAGLEMEYCETSRILVTFLVTFLVAFLVGFGSALVRFVSVYIGLYWYSLSL